RPAARQRFPRRAGSRISADRPAADCSAFRGRIPTAPRLSSRPEAVGVNTPPAFRWPRAHRQATCAGAHPVPSNSGDRIVKPLSTIALAAGLLAPGLLASAARAEDAVPVPPQAAPPSPPAAQG